jgi:ornithine--oxo-acid transaminase
MADKTATLIDMAQAYSAQNYHPLPVVLKRGEGSWVWDVEGKKYLDMLSSYSALNMGHCHPRIVEALCDQANRLTLTSRAFHNDLFGPFMKKLSEMTGMDAILPMNTGAEGVETAIKMVRRFGYAHKGIPEGKAKILVFENNFHGRTTTVVGFSSEEAYRKGFGPFTPGFEILPFGDFAALEAAMDENTCAVLMEPIQGEGGILIPPKGYLAKTAALCRERKVLFVLDEIQTGLGRTGKLFAYQHEEGASPDALILGKALGGGVYPVSAVAARREVMDVFDPGSHGSTFGGNPLACRVALASLAVLEEEKLPERAAELGAWFMEELAKIPSSHVTDVRGRGLFVGVEVRRESGGARPFCEKLKELGILCKETHDLVIRFAPPLTIAREDLEWALGQVAAVLKD